MSMMRFRRGAVLRCLLAIFLLPLSARAAIPAFDGAVAGRVTDRAGQPISDATIAVVELGRATTSGSDGRFRLGALPSGRYTISARRLGYVTAATSIVVANSAVEVPFVLDASAVRIDPVTVTATRRPVESGDSPLPVSALHGDQVHAEGGISLAHALAQLPGVRSVTSGQEIGKPMVRGLFGPRVLVLADGSRVEDYSWSDEDGPSLDARLAERIEVIKGPASVLYGSDAVSGLVNVIPAAVPFSSDGARIHREAIEAYGASNNIELGSALLMEGAQSRYGYRLSGTGRFSQNYQTPGGTQPNSSFWSFNGEGAFGIRGDKSTTTFRASHYGGEFHLLESSGPEPGDPTGGPVRQTLDERLQVANEYVMSDALRFETKAQYQFHSLTEVSDDCVPAPGQTTCTKVKDRPAFSMVLNTGFADVMLHAGSGAHGGATIGVSGLYQSSSSTGPIFLIPSGTIANAAVFALAEAPVGPLTFIAGARGDARRLDSDALADLQSPSESRSWNATTADIGAVYKLVPQLALIVNYGLGWRAPTLFDLYANGPNLAEARYEIGDRGMRAELGKNIDGGVRWTSDRVRADVSVYQNQIDHFIYTSRTSQLINGLRVFRHTQTNARLTGAELSGEVAVADPLSVHASYDFVRGTDRTGDVPLELMPPPRAIVGADLHTSRLSWARRASVGASVEVNQKQTRLNPNDFATNGYTLVNLDFALERLWRSVPVRYTIDIRNATNTSYRDFLSRYKEFAVGPGVNAILKATVGAW
jgi:outer membrane receptor protein involved in Fe transport